MRLRCRLGPNGHTHRTAIESAIESAMKSAIKVAGERAGRSVSLVLYVLEPPLPLHRLPLLASAPSIVRTYRIGRNPLILAWSERLLCPPGPLADDRPAARDEIMPHEHRRKNVATKTTRSSTPLRPSAGCGNIQGPRGLRCEKNDFTIQLV